MFKVRNLRPELSAYVMQVHQSIDHSWFADTGAGSDWHTALRLRPRRHRSDSFSSTYSRYTVHAFVVHLPTFAFQQDLQASVPEAARCETAA